MSIDPISAPVLGFVTAVANAPSPKPIPESPAAGSSAGSAEPIVPQARAIQVDASYGEGNRIIYRIVDQQTGELIQQIPPEQLLAIARSIRQLLQAEEETSRLHISS